MLEILTTRKSINYPHGSPGIHFQIQSCIFKPHVHPEVLEAAFTISYVAENKGDFSAAMDALKKVYNESSYEVNLRLGWLNYNAGLFD